MTGDLAPGFFSSDEELLEMAKSVASVRPGKGVFQCISQMTSNSRGLLPPGVAAGAFRFALDVSEADSWWARCQLAALEWGTNARATARELPYGDQGLFVLRSTLDRVGGWRADFPLLEVRLQTVRRFSCCC